MRLRKITKKCLLGEIKQSIRLPKKDFAIIYPQIDYGAVAGPLP